MQTSTEGARATALAADIERDAAVARASDIVELVELALGDLPLYERQGADGVGTADYPALAGARVALREVARRGDASARLAAAYALAFVLEDAAESLALLEALADTEAETRVKAGMLLAAARLRSTLAEIREGDDGRQRRRGPPALDASAPAALRVVEALERVFDLPDFPRLITPAWATALDAVKELGDEDDVGPWGGGSLSALVDACRRRLRVEDERGGARVAPGVVLEPAEDDGEEGPDDDDEVGHEQDDEGDDEDDGDDGDDDDDDDDFGGEEVDEDDDEDDDDDADDADADDDDDFGGEEVDDPYTQQRPERAAPRVSLAGLRDVDWGKLEHAYGHARGVPGMIDGLSSPDEDDRSWAIDALDASIHHQGSVYSASTAATPFLIALLGHREVEVRPEILSLLCGMAVYSPEEMVVEGARDQRSEAYAAVLAGGATYVRLLADGDARVRSGAAHVLAFCDPPPAGAREALSAALATEEDPRARASALIALGYVARYEGEPDAAQLLAPWLDHPQLLTRGAAAIATMQLLREAAPARVREIASSLRGAPRVRGYFPWGDVAEMASTLESAFRAESDLWDALDSARAPGATGAAREAAQRASPRLFKLLFVDDTHGLGRPWIPSELDDRRRRFLAFHVDTTPRKKQALTSLPFWEVASDVGLFPFAEAVARVLGRDPGPLDEEIEIDGVRRPIWAFFRAAFADPPAHRDALVAALAARPASARVSLLEDLLVGPHQLTRSPWHIEWGSPDEHPRSSQASNDYTSEVLVAMADIAGHDDEIVSWAEASAAKETAAAGKRDARRGVIAALVLARSAHARGVDPDAAFDLLLGFDQPPASTYRRALREALRLLPPERAAKLVLREPLYRYYRYIDPRGEVRRWNNGAAWAVLDAAPPEVVAREVVAARAEWIRHRAAGDDRSAEPVGGSRTTTMKDRPGDDEPFPEERAIALLRGVGDDVARAALAAAEDRIDDAFRARVLDEEITEAAPAPKKKSPAAKPKPPTKEAAPVKAKKKVPAAKAKPKKKAAPAKPKKKAPAKPKKKAPAKPKKKAPAKPKKKAAPAKPKKKAPATPKKKAPAKKAAAAKPKKKVPATKTKPKKKAPAKPRKKATRSSR